MAKALTTALRLMRLLMACWERPVLSLKDIQTLCQDDSPISEDTAYNYIATLQTLGVKFKRLSSKTWFVQQTPPFPPFSRQTNIHRLYQQMPQRHPLLDRLLGQAVIQDADTPADWLEAIEYKHVCHIKTGKRLITGVPLIISEGLLRLWDVDYHLPIHIKMAEVIDYAVQMDTLPYLLQPRLIVQFEVLDDLARRFEPTVDDSILERRSNRIRVANRCEDATALCKRLLRYQLQCRIIAPDNFRRLLLDELDWITCASFGAT